MGIVMTTAIETAAVVEIGRLDTFIGRLGPYKKVSHPAGLENKTHKLELGQDSRSSDADQMACPVGSY
jgi:hypothetical protein